MQEEEEEQRVEILITKASIIDRQKFEAGDVVGIRDPSFTTD